MELARETTVPPTPSTPSTPTTPTTPGKNKKKNRKKKKAQKQSREETTAEPAKGEPLPPVRKDVPPDIAIPTAVSDTGGVQLGSVPQTPSVLAEVRNLGSFGSSRMQEASGEPGDEDIDEELTRSQTWPPVDPSAAANSGVTVDDLAQSTGQQGPLRPNTAESSQGQPGRGGREGWASFFGLPRNSNANGWLNRN